jgi:hypothetical protein
MGVQKLHLSEVLPNDQRSVPLSTEGQRRRFGYILLQLSHGTDNPSENPVAEPFRVQKATDLVLDANIYHYPHARTHGL